MPIEEQLGTARQLDDHFGVDRAVADACDLAVRHKLMNPSSGHWQSAGVSVDVLGR